MSLTNEIQVRHNHFNFHQGKISIVIVKQMAFE
jgi:hypothetical protein